MVFHVKNSFIDSGEQDIGQGRRICSVCDKEGIILFNNVLNTFYLRWYGMTHMVKDHSGGERRNLLLPLYGLLFLISSKVFFGMTILQTG